MNSYDTLIIGTGCAALKCADELCHMRRKSLAILTDDERAGTSRNAGSDKQTYYKLTLSGFDGDSVGEMARTLFSGGCVDGTHALCEAALSAPCFLRLCELGVPFPTNRCGEYIGYKTDHDPRRRATSAGPLTSKMMAEALDKSVRAAGVPILNHRLAVSIATQNRRANGVVCLNTETGAFELYAANHIVWATGGPAAAYLNVSYPLAQSGMTGALLEAGAAAVNLTEWQYGLASIAPRWNVSGTYMQALPAFISTDRNGGDAREFLDGCFAAPGEALTAVFLKGYQWPFDARKAKSGSSRIDLLVQNEIARGRRVFLDFRVNPVGDRFALAGRVWEVEELDVARKLIYVKEVKGKMEISWPGDYGEIHTRILERMKQVLEEDTVYPYLKKNARKRLDVARRVARNTGMLKKSIVHLGGYTWCLFPWLGTRSFRTLRKFIAKNGAKFRISGMEYEGCCYMTFKMERGDGRELISYLSKKASTEGIDKSALVAPSECPVFEKYDDFIPSELLRDAYMADRLRTDEAVKRLAEIAWELGKQ